MSNPLKDLERHGQSPWIDMISREMIDSGELTRLLNEDGMRGLTSNPSIFEKAIAQSTDYDNTIARALGQGKQTPKEIFETLAIKDIQDAADILRPVYDKTAGADGFVSLEVSPDLAFDTEQTVEEAERLHADVHRKNLMIKVPATAEGLPAIAQLIGKGISVNVTLIFSIERYRRVMDAYLRGLEIFSKSGGDLSTVSSVASFFISRLDAAVEKQVPPDSPLIGKVAVANAKMAYQAYLKVFGTDVFKIFAAKGARVQRPLWASTGTKNPGLSDVLYIDQLIGKDTVNTIPPKTWAAFRDHGTLGDTLTKNIDEAQKTLADLKAAGIEIEEITRTLEKEGVDAFIQSFDTLLASIQEKADRLRGKEDPASPKKKRLTA